MTKKRQPARPESRARGQTRAAGAGRSAVTWETVRQVGLRLPGVEEGVSYRTKALRVRGKLIVRLKEDGETIVLRTDLAERDHLIAAAPEIFFLNNHYHDYPYVLVRMAALGREYLETLLSDAWRRVAPKTMVRARDVALPDSTARRGNR